MTRENRQGLIVFICVAMFGLGHLISDLYPHQLSSASPIDGFRLENWGQLLGRYLNSRDSVGDYSEETLGNAFTAFVVSMENGYHPRTVQENWAALTGEGMRYVQNYHRNWKRDRP